MRVDRFSMKWIIALVSLLATAALIAGCGGGGGGGGGGSTSVATYAYSGTVVDESNVAVPGDAVTFDGNGSYTSTTDANGKFSISGVPTTLLTGSDTLVVAYQSGTQAATYPIPAGSKSLSGIVIKIGPPAPPPLVRPKVN